MIRLTSLLCTLCLSTALCSQVQEGILLSQWSVDTLVGSRSFNNTYNEVWGVVNEGREYAIIGSTYGTHFIDVTDPTVAEEVAVLAGGTSSSEIIHRDYHDYDGYLYAVADEGNASTLQIIDFSFLPDSVHVVYDSKLAIRRSHNIFIDTARARLYSCISAGDTLSYSPLRIFDIADPENPQLLGSYFRFDGYRISQVHDIYVDRDTAFMNCGPDGLVIAEFSDPENPTTFAILEPSAYPDAGYNHSGYRTADGKHYVMGDEDWGFDVKLFNVEDLTNPELVSLFNADSESPFSITHNQLIKDDLLFCSYYYDGLQVFDISNPESPRRVMHYSTTEITHRDSYEGNWGVYPYLPSGNILLSDMQEGLFVLAPFNPIVSNELIPDPKSTLNVYPNPVKRNRPLTIKTSVANNFSVIKWINSKGELLDTSILDNGTTLVPMLSTGMYIVKIGNQTTQIFIAD